MNQSHKKQKDNNIDNEHAGVKITGLADLETWHAYNLLEPSTTFTVVEIAGNRYMAPYSTVDDARKQAIKNDTRALDDFRGRPTKDAYGAEVWDKLMEEGEAQMSGLFPTRRENLEAKGEWPTKNEL